MRQVIDYNELLANSDFVLWFLMTNFPEGMNIQEDYSLMELINEKCEVDINMINILTGYHEGVFDENDGYIESPKAVEIKLYNGDVFCVEFHPGDTLYYINNIQIGCTGPSYSIKNISFSEFNTYTKNMKKLEKLFLLPMVKVSALERNSFEEMIKTLLSDFNLRGCNIEDISACIVENCFEK